MIPDNGSCHDNNGYQCKTTGHLYYFASKTDNDVGTQRSLRTQHNMAVTNRRAGEKN